MVRIGHYYWLIVADLAQFEVNRQDGLYRKGKPEYMMSELVTDEMFADSRKYAIIIIRSFQCAKLPQAE